MGCPARKPGLAIRLVTEENIMSLVVNTNIAAMDAYRNLSISDNEMQSSLQKLSSGNRINTAADDASGLVISTNINSQVSGLKVAIQNANDGINVVQTADGALSTVTTMLQRIRDLAVQSANSGAQNSTSLAASQAEVTALLSQVDAIASQTVFNGVTLLAAGSLTFQVGADANQTLTVTTSDMSTTGLGLTGIDLTTDPSTAITTIDSALDSVNTFRGSLGATENRLQDTVTNLSVTSQNLAASASAITDTDMASEMTNYSKAQILTQVGTAMLSQANSSSQGVLKLIQNL
jgi:flagellin